MSITDEELAAFADDELDGERNAAVAKAVADDPALARKVDQHRALRAKLGDHFAPVLEDEVPTHLKDLLEPKDRVVDFARAKEAKRKGDGIRWGWIAAPALAASLALAVFLPRGSGVPEGYANADLAEALDTQLVASQGTDTSTRILLSFQRDDGKYCRAFSSSDSSGIACRDETGWALVEEAGGTAVKSGEFRQAGNTQQDLLERAQEMASGPALDADAERAAMETGWSRD
ncbi:MAG: anti-sigma factor [Parvibaculum sp.]|jgi:hypothetical protein|nr:anti-sigma factor [Parvibaculum sp.]|tara:strand:+ start:774 stop:1469 length:696 start_codon:yes stop_codon:yes gene_type:complete